MTVRRHRRKHPAAELNITAFMNLMVVLVPFLLMSTVFSQITILDLNLPKPGSQSVQDKKDVPYEIRVSIQQDAMTLSDNKGGIIKRISRIESGHNFAVLKKVLKQVKARFPDKTNITILSDQGTYYEDLIKVMDSVRSYKTFYEGEYVNAELFPDISIGDTPK